MKLKIITGYRKDQQVSVSAEEAHKAYYLFLNPDARTVFSDGTALKGSQIDMIEPDYNGTMGWNSTHTIDSDDMNEIRSKGIDKKMREVMFLGKQVAQIATPEELNLTLSELVKKYPQLQESNKLLLN